MSQLARILIVEDELPMRTVLRDCLQRHGYRVIIANNGMEGLEKATKEKPDLILLDIMMPKLDGFAVCSELRKMMSAIPILFLTAKGKIEDRVRGLDLGADDFLTKPFSRDELLARVRALLRRMERQARKPATLDLGNVHFDFQQQKAWRDSEEIHFTAKEFAMMRLLAQMPGTVIPRERFLDAVWGYAVFPTTRTVDKHIASLRSKIELEPEHPRWIKTIHAVGYRLELP